MDQSHGPRNRVYILQLCLDSNRSTKWHKTNWFKWLYKRKQDQPDKVQGLYPKRGSGLWKNSHMLKSIRILLSITTFYDYDYEIWQMDAKTSFLNVILKRVYMAQLEGFITQGEEQKVCKIQKSINGLKQTSRS